MVKPGPIIGLIIGIGLAVFPMIGMLMGEASLSDPKGKMIGFGFIIFGALMVVVNIIALAKGTDNLLADTPAAPAPSRQKKEEAEEESEPESEERKIRCRFCKKLYSAEYNGCPYCKKK